jgi:hypothetical protein
VTKELCKMKVSELLKFIPDEELEFLANETKVDYQVKKLYGINMFKLLLFSMINKDKPSLRVMERYYQTTTFKVFAETADQTTKFNSISDRINTINSGYFEKIFSTVFDKFSNYFQENNSLISFDSTMVAISSNLIDWGMRVGSKTNKKQIKYTVGMKGSFPCHVEIFGTQEKLSEDKTIPKAIINYEGNTESIIVFDRGVQARKTFELFSDSDIHFVTRAKLGIKYKLISTNKITEKPQKSSVIIEEDIKVKLKDENEKYNTKPFRLIKGIIEETGEPIYFLTNIEEMTAYEIARIYKMRWEIEVLFKFLKQQLNLSHLVSRSRDGLRVMIYMTLILSILIIAYKKANNIKGYMIAKLQLTNELESSIIKDIVLLCGGNPDNMKHIFNDT